MGSSRPQSPPAIKASGGDGGTDGGCGDRGQRGQGEKRRLGEGAAGGRRVGLARRPAVRPWV